MVQNFYSQNAKESSWNWTIELALQYRQLKLTVQSINNGSLTMTNFYVQFGKIVTITHLSQL